MRMNQKKKTKKRHGNKLSISYTNKEIRKTKLYNRKLLIMLFNGMYVCCVSYVLVLCMRTLLLPFIMLFVVITAIFIYAILIGVVFRVIFAQCVCVCIYRFKPFDFFFSWFLLWKEKQIVNLSKQQRKKSLYLCGFKGKN